MPRLSSRCRPLLAGFAETAGERTQKLWDVGPGLFPKLNYDKKRERWVVCGGDRRTFVAFATPQDHWIANDVVEADQMKGQIKSYREKVKAQKRRKKVFDENPDCSNTDEL